MRDDKEKQGEEQKEDYDREGESLGQPEGEFCADCGYTHSPGAHGA